MFKIEIHQTLPKIKVKNLRLLKKLGLKIKIKIKKEMIFFKMNKIRKDFLIN